MWMLLVLGVGCGWLGGSSDADLKSTRSGSPTSAEASGAAGSSEPLIRPGSVTTPAAPGDALGADQCNSLTDGGPLLADGCLTGRLKCGDKITGHTRGGVNRYDRKFYEKKYCTPATTDHDSGDERIYLLEITEPGMRAIVTLDTPCANLDLAAFTASTGESCPTIDDTVGRCEMNVKGRTTREKVDLFNTEPEKWFVVVEGQGDAEGAFGLTVQCEKWK
jgi:hypothetical protein